jgi:hypothetical protein
VPSICKKNPDQAIKIVIMKTVMFALSRGLCEPFDRLHEISLYHFQLEFEPCIVVWPFPRTRSGGRRRSDGGSSAPS